MNKRICSFRNNIIAKITNTGNIVNVKNMCGTDTVSSLLCNSQITKGLYPIKSGCLDMKPRQSDHVSSQTTLCLSLMLIMLMKLKARRSR